MLSIVIPLYNEEENISELHEEITLVMGRLKYKYEIIFVDDGSLDNTYDSLVAISKLDKNTKLIKFRKNFGQTAAFDAGIREASGSIIVTMDGDLQNDPSDIPILLNKLQEGYDVVSGWRFDRKDNFFKRIISRGANLLRRVIINDQINDSGCSLKAYTKECFDGLKLYGAMHRIMPALVQLKGFRIGEIKVNHRPRKYGQTKYSFVRTMNGFLDMLIVKFWMSFSTKPIHLFGGLGVISGVLGFCIASYLTYIKLFMGVPIANRPLLLLGALLIISGLILIVFGTLADILVKIYYKDNESYSIDMIINKNKIDNGKR